VLYSTPAGNIDDATIEELLRKTSVDLKGTNEDMSAIIPLFEAAVGKARIQLALAKKNTDGSPLSPIRHIPTTHGVFGNNDIHFSHLGGSDAINPDAFLNIWICDLPAGIKGYGTPSSTDAAVDGIVIDYEQLDNIFDRKERLLTHEFGHWLDLDHLWGTGGCSVDDGIADTPSQAAASSGCNTSKTSCGSVDMVQNFMDYSDEDCRLFFTKGQVEKMRNTLATTRQSIISQSSLTLQIPANTTAPAVVFPNPFDRELHLKVTHKNVHSIKVLNSQLQVVRSLRYQEHTIQLNVEEKGMYFLLFFDKNNKRIGIEKVIKQ